MIIIMIFGMIIISLYHHYHVIITLGLRTLHFRESFQCGPGGPVSKATSPPCSDHRPMQREFFWERWRFSTFEKFSLQRCYMMLVCLS